MPTEEKPYRSPKQRANALFARKLADAVEHGRTVKWQRLPYLGKPRTKPRSRSP